MLLYDVDGIVVGDISITYRKLAVEFPWWNPWFWSYVIILYCLKLLRHWLYYIFLSIIQNRQVFCVTFCELGEFDSNMQSHNDIRQKEWPYNE
jgi:hypothetical protein